MSRAPHSPKGGKRAVSPKADENHHKHNHHHHHDYFRDLDVNLYHVHEKYWTMTSKFQIRGPHDEIVYYQVIGKPFSWEDKLSFQDAEGKELLQIKQQLVAAVPTYKIVKNGKTFAIMTKEERTERHKQNFYLDVPGDNDYHIEGDIKQREYVFKRTKHLNKPVAMVSKKLLSLSKDCYSVSIMKGEDDDCILAACIIMDQILNL